MAENTFHSGFAVLAGLPNAGKSTLLNALAGGLLSAVTDKPQTTRQNILAIAEDKNYQIVFVDTPGFLHPRYKLQQTMAACVDRAVGEDADLILLLVDANAPDLPAHTDLLAKIAAAYCPVYLVLTKTDLIEDKQNLLVLEKQLKEALPRIEKVFTISAKNGQGVAELKQAVADAMPQSPAYFPPGQWTDRWERFYAAEFIREQIFKLYQKIESLQIKYCDIEKIYEMEKNNNENLQILINYFEESSKIRNLFFVKTLLAEQIKKNRIY
jgi:GTP-binding protein Era